MLVPYRVGELSFMNSAGRSAVRHLNLHVDAPTNSVERRKRWRWCLRIFGFDEFSDGAAQSLDESKSCTLILRR